MDIVNRALWAFVGLLFLLAGGLGTAVAAGALPVSRNTAVLAPQFLHGWRSIGGWRWGALIAGGLLIALLGLGLLRAVLRRPGGRPMSDLTGDDLREQRPAAGVAREARGSGASSAAAERLPGRTQVRTVALVHGIEDDLARYPAVQDAMVALTGDPGQPSLRTRLDVGAGTDLTKLRRYVTESLDRFTTTTGLRPRTVRIVIRLRGEAGSRTHRDAFGG